VGRLQQVGAPGHGAGNQRFQALLAGIGGHGAGESGALVQFGGWGLIMEEGRLDLVFGGRLY
jgi:hypothetical protein